MSEEEKRELSEEEKEKAEENELTILESDVLEEPHTNEDGLADLIIADVKTTEISEPTVDIGGVVESRRRDKKPEPDIVTPPKTEQELDIPLSNSAEQALNLSIKKNSALTEFLGDPIENDRLVEVLRENRSTSTLLNTIMSELAEESAYLKAQRMAKWQSGGVMEDSSELSLKRLRVLKGLVDTLSEKEKMRREDKVGKVDFHSDAFARVLKHFLDIILETFDRVGIPEQYKEIFFPALAKAFDGFEKKAEKLYYGKD